MEDVRVMMKEKSCEFWTRIGVLSIIIAGQLFQKDFAAMTSGHFDIRQTAHYYLCMELLHAPWRIQYLQAPKPAHSDVSIFAQIAQSNDDEANHVISRSRTCFAMLNKYPYSGGHLLVIPYKQTPDLHGLTDDELTDLMKLVRRCQDALTKVMKPNGFNIGLNLGRAAGAGIEEHVHIHIVPRWAGDTNFMPVVAGTMVLPEALADLTTKLRAAFMV
jgi:ATP adenylyltransferase